jgi:hypothetical protein
VDGTQLVAKFHDIPLKLHRKWQVGRKKRANLGWTATIPARGESISNLVKVVQQLRKERDQAEKTIEQLNEALKALTGIRGIH